jgi:hypothetical protein
MEYNMHAALALAAAASRWLPRARGRCLAFAVVASRWWLQPRAGGCSLALVVAASRWLQQQGKGTEYSVTGRKPAFAGLAQMIDRLLQVIVPDGLHGPAR